MERRRRVPGAGGLVEADRSHQRAAALDHRGLLRRHGHARSPRGARFAPPTVRTRRASPSSTQRWRSATTPTATRSAPTCAFAGSTRQATRDRRRRRRHADRGTEQPAEPEIYLPFWQSGAFSKHLVVRAAGDPTALAALVRRELRDDRPDVRRRADDDHGRDPARVGGAANVCDAAAHRLCRRRDAAGARRPLRRPVAVGQFADQGAGGAESRRRAAPPDRPADRGRGLEDGGRRHGARRDRRGDGRPAAANAALRRQAVGSDCARGRRRSSSGWSRSRPAWCRRIGRAAST